MIEIEAELKAKLDTAYRAKIEAIVHDQCWVLRIAEKIKARHGREAAEKYLELHIASVLEAAER